jgi:hypothetical protein
MNIDSVLRYLAPLTPAVLPVLVLIWHRTRRELGLIRRELISLRETRALSDPRLDEVLEALDGMRAELMRLGEAQRATVQLMAERDAARLRLGPDGVLAPGEGS